MKFVGLDVHGETISVAVGKQGGEIRSLGVIPNGDTIRILKTSPSFDHLRADPRYADLLRRMNIPQ
jgi:hypothetical protein